MAEFILSARNVRQGAFGANPGPTRFLSVPGNRNPDPQQAIKRKVWVDAVLAAGHTGQDPHTGEDCGDIVLFVHGFNTTAESVARRHRQFGKGLAAAGYRGALVSFDWPSDDRAMNYLEDRSDAKQTALRLVDDGISVLAARQFRGCKINIHVVAHSMGSYVVREAFDDADDRPAIAANNWTVSQICLVAADVSSDSMSAGDARSKSLYRHCTRLTNYQNPYDQVLKLSGVKRAGVAARAGRRGLPVDRHARAANVNCGDHYQSRYADTGDDGHSWYFEDAVFLVDLTATLAGDTDRSVTAARRQNARGELYLS